MAKNAIISMRIKENSWIARLAARKIKSEQVAITIGKTIHLYHVSRETFLDNSAWVRHETQHIRQFRQYGLFRFTCMYLWESMKKGYHNNKWEVEARAAEEARD